MNIVKSYSVKIRFEERNKGVYDLSTKVSGVKLVSNSIPQSSPPAQA